MSAPALGLLVVHGIGDQRGGELSREIATEIGGSAEPVTLAAGVQAARTRLGGRAVVVAEAHWSDLSSLDNPPAVRSVRPIIADLLQTIGIALRHARLSKIVRRADRRFYRVATIVLALAAAYALALLLAWAQGREVPDSALLWLGVLYLLFAVHLVWRSVRYRMARSRRAAPVRRCAEAVLWGAAAYLLGSLWVLILPIYGGILVAYFGVAILVTGALALALALVARALAALGALLERVRAPRVRRWTHRLGWVMVVLPAHSLLEAMRAAGNLLSVILTERSSVPRLAALAGLFGVYAGALVLMVLCELVYLPAIVAAILASDETITRGEAWALTVLAPLPMLAGYLWLIGRATPAIDLLLDVANYHLADAAERQQYHARVARAVAALQDEGCSRIHVLAHSLGTVLTYDWLQTLPRGGSPVGALLTIGSPLDKFWYVDHGPVRRRSDRAGLQGRLSGPWRNFWAPSDPVSGALQRYGAEGTPAENERLMRLGPPLVSHVRYWKSPVVMAAVRDALASGPQPATDS
jgi:hypothetical protein